VNAVATIAWGLAGICLLTAVAAIFLECRDGHTWKHGPFAQETRQYTEQPFDDLRFRRETDLALALLQPDDPQLPAEEA
jgi:hypothetical protein